MKKPDLKGVNDNVVQYIEFLENLHSDNLYLLYDAMRKKIKELGQAIDDSAIDLTEASDKSFDRLIKAMVETKSIVENLKFLRQELGLDFGKENEEKKIVNPMEIRAQKRANGRA